LAPKAIEFGEITHNKGHDAVQGHSRSPKLVSSERPYATWVPVFNTLVLVEPLNWGHEIWLSRK